MLLSKKYIRKVFMDKGIQLSEEALNDICFKLKTDIHKYALNAEDVGIKRLTRDKVPIIIGDFDVRWRKNELRREGRESYRLC